jgi:hypothetical protein
VFLSLMKKNYRSTFWSMETGNAWVQSYFLHGGSDSIKMNVLNLNKAKWKAIEPQVKELVEEGWMGWERDKPDWFTDNWKARVPADWVPKEGKAEHLKARETVRKTERRPRLSRLSSLLRVQGEGDEGGGAKMLRPTLASMNEEDDKDEMDVEGSMDAIRAGSRVQPVIR